MQSDISDLAEELVIFLDPSGYPLRKEEKEKWNLEISDVCAEIANTAMLIRNEVRFK